MVDLKIEEMDPEDFQNYNHDQSKIQTDFTGREQLISSIEEKCFQRLIKRAIAKEHFSLDSEQQFFKSIADRINLCASKA